ncbi:MAG: hypothetical protein CEE40_01710 [Chloroflexi bacterium B3_Chlor]|nr:MAG: hypothetical protein CEE40_01710 [Chloroflexi bacterium B3_Chlor]
MGREASRGSTQFWQRIPVALIMADNGRLRDPILRTISHPFPEPGSRVVFPEALAGGLPVFDPSSLVAAPQVLVPLVAFRFILVSIPTLTPVSGRYRT